MIEGPVEVTLADGRVACSEKIFAEAGAPEGVFSNLFMRTEDEERGIAHRAVQGVSLTGSERAGAAVAQLAGKHLKKCVLELGGSDPFIVLQGVDLDKALSAAVAGHMSNTGQSCVAAKRFLIPEDQYPAFVDGLTNRIGLLRAGDPTDPATTLGPLSSEEAAQKLLEQIDDAVGKGATATTGGGRPAHRGPGDRGALVEPTVLTGVTPDMRAYSEELFGPVAVVHSVLGPDEAVELANGSPYGLGATVMGPDSDQAEEIACRIDSGMVWINHPTMTQPNLPFGGIKNSGFGRELSEMGMYEFANKKFIRVLPA